MRTKLILMSFLAFCLMTTVAVAQNCWGIMAGVNLSTSTAHSSSLWSVDSKWKVGGYMGGLYDIQLNSSWYIQPQLIFSYEVDRAKYLSGKKVSDDLDVSTSMYSLTLPVLASFKVSLNDVWALRINAGPYVQYAMFGRDRTLFTADSKEQSYSSSWDRSFLKHFIFGLKGGMSLERNHWMFSLDCKYSLMKHSLNHDGHGLTLSTGIGYKF